MRWLDSDDKKKAFEHIIITAQIALGSTCQRSRCGSVIIKNGELIGSGFNSPPQNKEEQRKCLNSKVSYHKKVTDKTCCVHAEQRAIMDTLIKNPDKIIDSRLYFVRLDEQGKPSPAGKPYCTICSKMALDAGVKEFVLWHNEGICSYSTDEYNHLSFQYKG